MKHAPPSRFVAVKPAVVPGKRTTERAHFMWSLCSRRDANIILIYTLCLPSTPAAVLAEVADLVCSEIDDSGARYLGFAAQDDDCTTTAELINEMVQTCSALHGADPDSTFRCHGSNPAVCTIQCSRTTHSCDSMPMEGKRERKKGKRKGKESETCVGAQVLFSVHFLSLSCTLLSMRPPTTVFLLLSVHLPTRPFQFGFV